MSKQKRTVGDFLEMSLPNGKWGYARVLNNASYAIYDLMTDEAVEVSEIDRHDILFTLAVYKNAVTSGRWVVIGCLPLEESLMQLPIKFIQDEIDPEKFNLYNPNTGTISPAKKQDCVGLERAAVWDPLHVEERIVDYFSNKPNNWCEEMKIK